MITWIDIFYYYMDRMRKGQLLLQYEPLSEDKPQTSLINPSRRALLASYLEDNRNQKIVSILIVSSDYTNNRNLKVRVGGSSSTGQK